jgi:hypothetical protein
MLDIVGSHRDEEIENPSQGEGCRDFSFERKTEPMFVERGG